MILYPFTSIQPQPRSIIYLLDLSAKAANFSKQEKATQEDAEQISNMEKYTQSNRLNDLLITTYFSRNSSVFLAGLMDLSTSALISTGNK